MALNFGKLNFSTSFNPTSAFPIDARTYFEDYDAAVAAAATAEAAGSSNTTYYIGQILTVYAEGAVSAYQITAAKQLQKLASTTASGDLSADVAELQSQVGELQTQMTQAQQDIDAVEGEVDTLQAGLEAAEGEIDTLQTTVEGHTSSISTIEGNVSALTERVTTAEGEIDTLQTQIEGLTGAMHFVGTSTTDPATGTVTIDGKPEYQAASGDVCLYDGKEYVYDGNTWQEFGDEGDHLTKGQADTYYVPLARTVNGKALSANITLTAEDVGAATEQDITEAIGALDLAEVQVGAAETLATISQTNGVLAATKQSIAIPHTAVTDWDTELAKKQNSLPAEGTGLLKMTEGVPSIDSTEYLSTEDAAETYLGLHAKADQAATADKVVNKLIIGEKEFDGSAETTVTAADLGALTAVPQATTDALGGIKLGHVDSGEGDEYAVELDGEGKAFVTVPVPEMPDVPAYTAGDGISVTPNENDFIVAIAANGVTTDKIADGAITDAKIAANSLNVQKLFVAEGDALILNGGDASSGSAAE